MLYNLRGNAFSKIGLASLSVPTHPRAQATPVDIEIMVYSIRAGCEQTRRQLPGASAPKER